MRSERAHPEDSNCGRRAPEEEAAPLPRIEKKDLMSDEESLDLSATRDAQMIHRRPARTCNLTSHMFKYLKRTTDFVLQLVWGDGRPEMEMHAYADANFAPPHQAFESVQGVVLAHGPNVAMWHSRLLSLAWVVDKTR